VQVGASNGWTVVACGSTFSFGINGGRLFAWGNNLYGDLGNGSTVSVSSPVQIGSSTTWRTVSGSILGNFALGVNNGILFSWGQNNYGQLGIGTLVNHSSPVQVGTSQAWTAVAAGGNYAFAISGSALFAWGANTFGQLGAGNTKSYSSPVQVGTASTWNIITGAGNDFTLGFGT
jgi:alpha-tubulin suppressor-like RCC1 family protein